MPKGKEGKPKPEVKKKPASECKATELLGRLIPIALFRDIDPRLSRRK